MFWVTINSFFVLEISPTLDSVQSKTIPQHKTKFTTIDPIFWETRTSVTIKDEKAIKENFTR